MAPQPLTRHRKIREIDARFHYSLIGACLSLVDLRSASLSAFARGLQQLQTVHDNAPELTPVT